MSEELKPKRWNWRCGWQQLDTRLRWAAFAPQGPLLERLQGMPVEVREYHPRGGLDTPAGLYLLLRLSWFLRRENFDVVHTHDLWSNLLGVPAARLAGRAGDRFQSPRPGPLRLVPRASAECGLRRIQNLSGMVLANATPITATLLISADGFKAEKVRVILNGVDIERFPAAGTCRPSPPVSWSWRWASLSCLWGTWFRT